jgi:DNA end-binding protein Ku
MPHAYWSGFLRLSLVSCPIYLSAATTERERISLHQINPETGNRSRVLELSRFVERDDINMLYLDAPYYVYPENEQAEEAYHVITAALQKSNRVGVGRIVVSQRERPVALEPFEGGMLLSMLRTAEEVRRAEFEEPSKKLDPQMVDIATTIIDRFTGKFEPKGFHDLYQDALRALVDAKMKGMKLAPKKIDEPSDNVVDLMAVLKKSLAASGSGPANQNRTTSHATEEEPPAKAKKAGAKKTDARQRSMLLPVEGGKKAVAKKAAEPAAKPKRKRA